MHRSRNDHLGILAVEHDLVRLDPDDLRRVDLVAKLLREFSPLLVGKAIDLNEDVLLQAPALNIQIAPDLPFRLQDSLECGRANRVPVVCAQTDFRLHNEDFVWGSLHRSPALEVYLAA